MGTSLSNNDTSNFDWERWLIGGSKSILFFFLFKAIDRDMVGYLLVMALFSCLFAPLDNKLGSHIHFQFYSVSLPYFHVQSSFHVAYLNSCFVALAAWVKRSNSSLEAMFFGLPGTVLVSNP